MASPLSPATEVRQAKPGDRPAVTATVTAAFAADPAWSYILGADSSRLAAAFTEVLFDLRVGSGDVWVTDDVSAVAMWEPPGGPRLPPDAIERLWQGYRAMAGEEAWQRMQDYDHAVAPARPTTPYWYLGVLATRPDRQGEGLGTAVMEPVFAMADRDGAACCLETCTTANRDFYGRRGFTDTTEVRPPDGPTIWWLRREPRVVP